MSRFMIPVSWTVDATVTIQADSIEEAVNSIEDGPLPKEYSYREDSYLVHEEDALIGIQAVHVSGAEKVKAEEKREKREKRAREAKRDTSR